MITTSTTPFPSPISSVQPASDGRLLATIKRRDGGELRITASTFALGDPIVKLRLWNKGIDRRTLYPGRSLTVELSNELPRLVEALRLAMSTAATPTSSTTAQAVPGPIEERL